MNRYPKPLPTLTILALCIFSALLLPGCSSGGGTVGTDAFPTPLPRPPPPPPPPAPVAEAFCPPPVTGDCVVDPPYTFGFDENRMQGGRQSDYALILRSTQDSWLTLLGDYRFSGGTIIERGTLIVDGSLHSDTTVWDTGTLWLRGTLTGDLTNNGLLVVGQTRATIDSWSTGNRSRIEGDYVQSATGTLSFTLGLPLQISGQARLDGTAELRAELQPESSAYLFPNTPSSQRLLHADGGVFGQFANWTSPGLFIEGNLRYAPNDVFFDLTRISALNTMASASVGDALTLNAAGNFDKALAAGDGFATLSSAALTDTQRQFLQSAASIQRTSGYDQAVRTFDSLSGFGHVAAADALLNQALTSASRSSVHLDNLEPDSAAGLWSAPPALVAGAAGTFFLDQTFGYAQWLSDRLVFGSSFGWTQGSLQFERSGGSAYSQAPQWNAYLRRNGSHGSYLMGEVGFSHQQLGLDRLIDLGAARRTARSEYSADVTYAYVESGRTFRVGSGYLTPFAGLGYAALNSPAFTEQGSTGFELIGQPALYQRVSSDIGLRYEKRWGWKENQRLRFNLTAGFQHLLVANDDVRAAFTGTPGVEFDLRGLPLESDVGWLDLSLAGSAGDHRSWLFDYANRAGDQTLSVGMAFQLR